VKPRSRNGALHVFCFLLFCDSMANILTDDSGLGNRPLVYSVRGVLIAYALMYSLHVSIGLRVPFKRRVSMLPIAMTSTVCWVTLSSVCHPSADAQSLFEPFRYWYWLSFVFFYCCRRQSDIFRVLVGWGTALFLLWAWRTISIIGARAFDSNLLAVNYSYMLLAVFPWLMLSKRRWLVYAATVVVVGACFAGLKRGAMVSVVLIGITSTMANFWTRTGRRWFAVWTQAALTTVAFIGAGLAAFQYRGDGILKRLAPEAGLSGREDIYWDSYRLFQHSTWSELLLGRGPLSTLQDIGSYAHNDWLQLVLDFGVPAGILYLWIHVEILRLVALQIRLQSGVAVVLLAAYCVFAVRGLSGGYINYPEMIYFACLLGLAARGASQEVWHAQGI
jgi:hypothetical protein